jgi:type VI secretion system protein VasD
MSTLRRQVLLMPALLALSYCAPPPPKPPAVLTLTAIGGADQNPGPSGAPAPVEIWVFLLNNTGRFNSADVFALTEHDKAALGEDEAGSETFVLAPGETHTVTRKLKPGVQAVGVVALYRDIDSATWRASAPVADSGPTQLTLKVGKLAVSLAPAS